MFNEIVFDIETQNTFADVENDFKKFKKYITNEIKKILGD